MNWRGALHASSKRAIIAAGMSFSVEANFPARRRGCARVRTSLGRGCRIHDTEDALGPVSRFRTKSRQKSKFPCHWVRPVRPETDSGSRARTFKRGPELHRRRPGFMLGDRLPGTGLAAEFAKMALHLPVSCRLRPSRQERVDRASMSGDAASRWRAERWRIRMRCLFIPLTPDLNLTLHGRTALRHA
jgi:hypothetical protein